MLSWLPLFERVVGHIFEERPGHLFRIKVILERRIFTGHFTFTDSPVLHGPKVYYDKSVVKQVDIPTLTGRFGVLAEHVPTIGCLKPGIVGITEEDGGVKNFFVSSGIVTVNADSTVQVLAEEAVTLDQLDANVVKDGLARATSEYASAQTDVAKAEAQITLEAYEELSRAVESRH